jgi:hypothetical protein
MKYFIKKFLIFILPIFIILGIPISILLCSGEFSSANSIIIAQANTEKFVQYGSGYNNITAYYKYHSLLYRNPDIISLGTSRVMNFRSKFFTSNYRFFNCGGGVQKIKHFNYFLQRIPAGKEPKVIIISLDPHFFNPEWDDLSKNDFETNMSLGESGNVLGIIMNNWIQIYSDIFNNKISLRKVYGNLLNNSNKEFIGLYALMNNNGFLNDGSYYYGHIIANPDNPELEDYQLKRSISYIENGMNRFKYGQSVSQGSLIELKSFLSNCKSRNIIIVAFLPPFPKQIYELMKNKYFDQYKYMFDLENKISPIFKEYGFEFYNFLNPESIGAQDLEYVDGEHLSEKAYLRLCITMCESGNILKNYCDVEYLKTKLEQSTNYFDVFYNEF